MGSLYCAGLQNFDFSSAPEYSVIWCQWVLGHLTQEHLVQFFIRAARGLKPGAVPVTFNNFNLVDIYGTFFHEYKEFLFY